ncbi:MAG: NAD kinase [Paenibacillaceae bacterium]|jgi:NAD+ kinase|nr:NAD kinase [Paenibacillaceae bacterium]
MRFFTVARHDAASESLCAAFCTAAVAAGLVLDDTYPDVVVSIGGDGTMLHAFHRFQNNLSHTAFVGVHTGHLGFYADWKPSEIPALITHMVTAQHDVASRTVQYPLLHIVLHTHTDTRTVLALNECTIKGADATLVADVRINDSVFEHFRGDGLCISTPSGSTAYNKSLSGALVHPALEAIQLAEIASINNRVFRTIGSPIVLPKHHHCDILPKKQRLLLSIDHIVHPIDDILTMRLSVAEQKVHFVRYRPFPFWDRVREAFLQDEHFT